MTNMEIYRKTLKFSLLRLLVGIAGLVAGTLIAVAGYYLSRGAAETTHYAVTGVCIVVGIVVFGLIVKYLGYMLKAGQIAMITRGVTEGNLPQDVVAEGKAEVKKRFVTANVYFLLTGAIKGITSQITNVVTKATSLLGGSDSNSTASGILGTIGALISAFISIVLEYVNYCCLGWVFYNKDQNAFKSTCDGAVLYFQNWKTLLKNAGKVLGITIVSLILIGGLLCVMNVAIVNVAFPELSESAADSVAHISAVAEDDTLDLTPQDVAFLGAIIIGIVGWTILHGVFVEPYLLVSAMRSYMDAGRGSTIGWNLYEKLCGISQRFKKLFERAKTETGGDMGAQVEA